MKDNQVLPERESDSPPLQSQSNPLDRILVVEDEPAIRELNAMMLTRSGYEVGAAEDGAAAWDALNEDSYDLLITDNVMPRLTGFKLLEKLYAARMTLPVIMATSAVPAALFTRGPWRKPAATLLKPYTSAELLRTVKKVLREADNPAYTVARPGEFPAPHSRG